MATRLRLQRHGKKGKPFYHVVAADARAPRDGRFIEKVGTYNPNTNPATIEVKHDRALYWLQVGAEMSDTVRALMKYKGVVYHNHLLNGVKKGAFTEEEAQKRFEKWMADKNAKVQSKIDALASASDKEKAARLKAEQEVNAAREAAQQAAENAAAEAKPLLLLKPPVKPLLKLARKHLLPKPLPRRLLPLRPLLRPARRRLLLLRPLLKKRLLLRPLLKKRLPLRPLLRKRQLRRGSCC